MKVYTTDVVAVSYTHLDVYKRQYLDIGLIDTMKDLFVNFIGAVVFSIIGFFYVKQRGKGKFANRFIPRIKDENADFLKIVEEDRKAEKVQKEDSDSNP